MALFSEFYPGWTLTEIKAYPVEDLVDWIQRKIKIKSSHQEILTAR